MSFPLKLENDALRVTIQPQFGGKVHSLIDRADEFELLFDYPAEFPTTCQYDQPYGDSYYAGWDECLPAIAAGAHPAHPYQGINIPDHGELWSLPTHSYPAKDGVTTEWQSLRFGYMFKRHLMLEGLMLRADYELCNHAPFEVPFVWAQHALLSMQSPVRIDMPAGRWRLSHDAQSIRFDQRFEWPAFPEGLNFVDPSELPAGGGWKLFSHQLIADPARVLYPQRKRSLAIHYESDVDLRAYWGVWINTGGWAGQRHFALEPTTGRYDELDRSVSDGSAALLPASGKITWTVRWTVGSI